MAGPRSLAWPQCSSSRRFRLPGHLRRGAAAAVSGRHPGHAQSVGHPANLLYNVVSTAGPVPVLAATSDRRLPGPGAHRRDVARRRRRTVIRVKVLPGPRVVDQVVAAVLLPLGAWLVVTRPSRPSLLVGKVAEGAGDADEWCRTVPW